MRIIRFTLSGRTAFFKKPEMNAYYYFTYGNIHKVAVLGIFGAILGYGGYSSYRQMLETKKKRKENKALSESFPEFYERLKDLQISILPNQAKGYIPKKIQVFNNSVGYASKEKGGNLIIKEQWLENPSWDICFLADSKEAENLAEKLLLKKCAYIPYLGSNDHFADITNVHWIDTEQCQMKEVILDCLFPKAYLEAWAADEFDLDDPFKYEEKLPYTLDPLTNLYKAENFIYTNYPVELTHREGYSFAGKNLVFY